MYERGVEYGDNRGMTCQEITIQVTVMQAKVPANGSNEVLTSGRLLQLSIATDWPTTVTVQVLFFRAGRDPPRVSTTT